MERENNQESLLDGLDSVDKGITLAEFIAYMKDERDTGAPIFKLSELTKLCENQLSAFGVKIALFNSHQLKKKDHLGYVQN